MSVVSARAASRVLALNRGAASAAQPARRCFSSPSGAGGGSRGGVGKITRLQRDGKAKTARPEDTVLGDGPEIEAIAVSSSTRAKNAALALGLASFCGGVMWYSMNAVGQAGSGGGDDPLAQLKEEAQEARERHDREMQQSDDATAMLKQFQAGEYDPDKSEEEQLLAMEKEEAAAKQQSKKRPWWKFW